MKGTVFTFETKSSVSILYLAEGSIIVISAIFSCTYVPFVYSQYPGWICVNFSISSLGVSQPLSTNSVIATGSAVSKPTIPNGASAKLAFFHLYDVGHDPLLLHL